MKAWNGIDLDAWCQSQTLGGPPIADRSQWYSGYEPITIHWSHLVAAIPLDIRFANFSERLARATARIAK